MEADKVTEEPQTTMDAKEHPSSKDPATEDLQEPSISETTLEPSISQNPLEAQASESLLEPSVSEPPLDKSTFETPLQPHTSENPLEPSTYVTSFEESTSVIPLEAPTSEAHTYEVPEKHITFQSSPVKRLSVSSTDISSDDLSESLSSEVSWTRMSSQDPEYELLTKYSHPGPSLQDHMDTSTKQKEDSGEDKEGMDTSDITAQKAHPEHQLGQKKEKKGVSRNCSCSFPCSHYCPLSLTYPRRRGLCSSWMWPFLLIVGTSHFPLVTQPLPPQVTQAAQWFLLSRQS